MLGTGSVIATVIAVYARPYIKNAPILSCAILAILAIVVNASHLQPP